MGLLNTLKKILLLSSVLVLATGCSKDEGGGSGTVAQNGQSDSGGELAASEQAPTTPELTPTALPPSTSPDLAPEGFDPTAPLTKPSIPLVPTREAGPLPEDVTPGPTPFGIPIDPAPRTGPTIPPPTKGPAPVTVVPTNPEDLATSPGPFVAYSVTGTEVTCGAVLIKPNSVAVFAGAPLPMTFDTTFTNASTSSVQLTFDKSYSGSAAAALIATTYPIVDTMMAGEVKNFTITFNLQPTTPSLSTAGGSPYILEVSVDCPGAIKAAPTSQANLIYMLY